MSPSSVLQDQLILEHVYPFYRFLGYLGRYRIFALHFQELVGIGGPFLSVLLAFARRFFRFLVLPSLPLAARACAGFHLYRPLRRFNC